MLPNSSNHIDSFKHIDFNPEFASAFNLIENTCQNILVTGKAGTGKSTLLQYFRHRTEKKIAVLAPTGVAAINIKGQTIHSFFMFRPDITPDTVDEIFVIKKKRKLYAELQTLIIDEISMVRADTLDCIDMFLRLHGPKPMQPFGGVQMVFFGDLYQLPPVVRRDEEEIFRTHYKTPYFFGAKSFENFAMTVVELKEIYRQKDEHFINILNAIRHNELKPEHLKLLNSRLHTKLDVQDDGFYISLTTTNDLAERINMTRMKQLPGDARRCTGTVSGEFEKSKNLPTQEALELKIGAQVMMLTNDPEKRWVNGSLGKIVEIHEDPEGKDIIMVELSNGSVVDVNVFTWEIFQFYYDEELESLSSRVIGYFTQYPLKLAWAVTIHKAQGQTFERIVLDLGYGTFAHGQLYVALSRCTTLEGIVLKQPIEQRHVRMDAGIREFFERFAPVVKSVKTVL
jgi:ATP-dependent DNA helicase PIF1